MTIASLSSRLARTFAASTGAIACAALFVGAAVLPAPASASETTRVETTSGERGRIVYAANAEGRRTAAVRYGDLDLGSDAGRATLERRLRTAARQVCDTGIDDVVAQADQQRCRSEAVVATRRAVETAVAAAAAERRAG
jgi:UrcA family protein